MRDLNFFETYIDKSEFKIDRGIIFVLIASLIVVMFIFNSIYNSFVIRQKTREVEILKSNAEDIEVLAKVEKIKTKKEEVEVFSESLERIEYLDETIKSKDIIDEELLNFITVRMPKNLFLTYLNIGEAGIQIEGISRDKLSIARFEKALEDLGDLEDLEEIFIESITLEDGSYTFTMDIILEGADLTEDEEDDGELEDEDRELIEEDEG